MNILDILAFVFGIGLGFFAWEVVKRVNLLLVSLRNLEYQIKEMDKVVKKLEKGIDIMPLEKEILDISSRLNNIVGLLNGILDSLEERTSRRKK